MSEPDQASWKSLIKLLTIESGYKDTIGNARIKDIHGYPHLKVKTKPKR
jgi:hypothetical protein